MEREYNVGTWLTPSDEYIKDIKQTLVEKGLIKESTNNEDIAKDIEEGLVNLKPENVRGNVKVGNVTGTIETKYDEINIDSYKKIPESFAFIFYALNGKDAYASHQNSSYSQNYIGIWHINLETGELTQIYNEGYLWREMFESSDGTIYMSGSIDSSYAKGIIHIKDNIATKLDTPNYGFSNFYEDSKGNIYASARNVGTVHISNKTVTTIYQETTFHNKYWELKNGLVYCTGTQSGLSNVLILDGTTTTSVEIEKNKVTNSEIYETKNGEVYLYRPSYYITLRRINSDFTVDTISDSSEQYQRPSWLVEDQFGNLYHFNTTTLYYISNGNSKIIYEFDDYSQNQYTTPHINNNNELYVGGSGSAVGVLYVKGENVVLMRLNGGKYFNRICSTNRYTYACCSWNPRAVYILEGDVATLISSSSNVSSDYGIFKGPKGQVYVYSSSMVTILDDEKNMKIVMLPFSLGGIDSVFIKDGYVIFCNNNESSLKNSSKKAIFDGNDFYMLVKGGE